MCFFCNFYMENINFLFIYCFYFKRVKDLVEKLIKRKITISLEDNIVFGDTVINIRKANNKEDFNFFIYMMGNLVL